MGARQLAAVLAVAVVGLGAALGWTLARGGGGEEATAQLRSDAAPTPLTPGRAPLVPGVGPSMMEPGTMGYPGYRSGRPVRTLAEAKQAAERFGEPLGLRVGETIEFENNFYAELVEPDGERATEVLVDPPTGNVWLEHGPAMMWNTRYGMMGGFAGPGGMTDMMGGGYGSAPWLSGGRQAAISGREAGEIANRWLRAAGKDLRAGEAERFPGYYTLDVLGDDRMAGMLSVNAFSGAVWYHWWHGRFVREES